MIKSKVSIVLFSCFCRKKIVKSESKSVKDELDTVNPVIKTSVNSDIDDEKEKKKDRELLVK